MFSSCARINTWSIVQFGVINIVSVQPSVVNANIRYNDKNGQLHFSGSSKYLMENISNDPLTLLYPNIPWSMGWWSCEPTIQYCYSLFTQIFLTQLFSTVFCWEWWSRERRPGLESLESLQPWLKLVKSWSMTLQPIIFQWQFHKTAAAMVLCK